MSFDSNMKIIIFHELVDRFPRRPRFPAAPWPNYRRLAIRHRGDSKKSTRPCPAGAVAARRAASRSRVHFYKNAETDRGRPVRSRAVLRRRTLRLLPAFYETPGGHPVGAATARTLNIDHRKKSRRIAVISRN